MTTIATDGKTMAADGQAEVSGSILTSDSVKVVRLPDGSLFGSAGRRIDRPKAVAYMVDGGKKPKLVDFQALHLKVDGSLWYLNEELEPTRVNVPCAVGSGMDFALGAMDFGASPEEALAVAIERDPSSGGLISVLCLDEKLKAVA